MDLSSLSTDDLQAIQRGDMSAVSTAGLRVLSGKQQFGSGKSYDAVGGKLLPTGSAQAKAAYDPVAGMGTWSRLGAGFDNGLVNLGQGIGQTLGLVSRKDVQSRRDLVKPLENTTAGKVGTFSGTVAGLLPAAAIPGANTVGGAAAIGAGSGLLQPSTSTKETVENTALGGVAGPLGLLGGRVAGAGWNLLRGIAEPFLPGGPTRIASRALQNFAGGDQEAAAAAQRLQNPPSMLPGVQPTTAELAQNPGISQLQRSLQNDPNYLTAITNRQQANRSAMTNAIGGIAGTDADKAAAEAAREAWSKPLYDQAKGVQVPADSTLSNLMGRPSMQAAWRRAQTLAAESGEPLVSGVDAPEHVLNSSILDASGKPAFSTIVPATQQTYSGKAIQYLKMGLNDIANTAEQKGMGAHEQQAVNSSLSQLKGWITKNVPALRDADQAFEWGSGPINQMQVGQKLSDKLIPALNDFGNAGGLNANNYANALRNGDQLAAQTTGWQGATLDKILSPDQMTTVKQVGEHLARIAGTNIGRATGSNTVQNMVGQNTLRQTLGPLGLPQSLAETVVGRALSKPIQFGAKVADEDVQAALKEALLDPKKAAGLLQMRTNPRLAKALWNRQGLLSPLTVGTGNQLVDTSQQ